MNGSEQCPFLETECTGGTIYPDGSVGCGLEGVDGSCIALECVPAWQHPRDWMNERIMETENER